MLRATYDLIDEPMRERVASLARRTGRVVWVDAAAGGKQGRRLATMTTTEWQSAVKLLLEARRFDELWRLAQAAPSSGVRAL